MMKPHCDNCDAVIIDASLNRRVSIQPWGYQCEVTVTIHKAVTDAPFVQEQLLCANCLHTALLAFADSLKPSLVGWGDTREKSS